MNKDISYWIYNFNFVMVIQGFNSQYMDKFKKAYYGPLNLIVTDRKDVPEVQKRVDNDRYLTGFLPRGEKGEYWDYDFFISPENVEGFDDIVVTLEDIIDKVAIFQFIVVKSETSPDALVILNENR